MITENTKEVIMLISTNDEEFQSHPVPLEDAVTMARGCTGTQAKGYVQFACGTGMQYLPLERVISVRLYDAADRGGR